MSSRVKTAAQVRPRNLCVRRKANKMFCNSNNNCIWIIIILLILFLGYGNNGCGCSGGCGNSCGGCGNDCGCGCN